MAFLKDPLKGMLEGKTCSHSRHRGPDSREFAGAHAHGELNGARLRGLVQVFGKSFFSFPNRDVFMQVAIKEYSFWEDF